MRNQFSKPLFLMILSFSWVFSSCQAQGGAALKVDAFEKQLQATPNAQLIDVRSPEEFKTGHLKGAVNIDWNGKDFEAQVAKLDKSKPTFVYCLSGVRSGKAADKLTKLGYTKVYKMEGGIEAWTAAGKPVDK